MKNILILGANSFVGYKLTQKLKSIYNIIPVSRSSLPNFKGTNLIIGDSTNIDFITTIIKKNNITHIINCVCIGNVDQCEKEKDQAKLVNYLLIEKLVDLSLEFQTKLIHFSTNAVYDGDHPLYSEDSTKRPKNYYGKLKASADDYIKNKLQDYLLIRVMTLFGDKESYQRHNPASMIIGALLDKKPLKLVNDLYSNLLFIDDLILFVELGLSENLTGEFNISGDEIVNRYELGLMIANIMELKEYTISECTSDAFPSLTERAPNTSFNNTKIKNVPGMKITPIKEAIEITVKRILNGNN